MPEKIPFKRLEVHDLFTPERVATFERPTEAGQTIIINTGGATDFHLDADTLKVVADVLFSSAHSDQIGKRKS